MDFREALQAGKIGIGGASDHWTRLFAQKVLGGYVQGYAEGAIASFSDGVNAPVDKLLVAINPVQSGTGDPSPTNVRPISGWTGANVTRTGKNLFLFSDSDKTASLSGMTATFDKGTERFSVSGTETRGSSFVLLQNNSDYHIPKFTAGETYYLCIQPTSGGVNNSIYFQISYRTKSNTNATLVTGSNSKQFTVPANFDHVYNIFVGVYAGAADIDYSFKVQIVSGSAATPYTPYTGTTYPITFPTEAGTVYGGELDVTSGVLTATYALYHLDENTSWSKGGSQTTGGFNRYYAHPTPSMKSGREQWGLCDKFPIGVLSSSVPAVVLGYSNNAIQVLSTANNTTEFASEMESIGGIDVVYPLTYPLTYQLTPTEVTTLLGVNNVWADTGDVKVWYKKKK